MGLWFELAYRDLYPAPPLCDCHHTYKVPGVPEPPYADYHEQFVFNCGGLDFITRIDMNQTDEGLAVYNQTMTKDAPNLPIPGLDTVRFKTATVAYKEAQNGGDQYEWVIEFTCGELPSLGQKIIDTTLFPGGIVVMNFYSRVGPHGAEADRNFQEMTDAANALGLGWVMEKWGWGFHKVPAYKLRNCKYPRDPPPMPKQSFRCNHTAGACYPVKPGYSPYPDEKSCLETCPPEPPMQLV